MERQLKHHEKKLLKKVNFLDYKRESTARENTILRRYMVLKREDYTLYAFLRPGQALDPSYFRELRSNLLCLCDEATINSQELYRNSHTSSQS